MTVLGVIHVCLGVAECAEVLTEIAQQLVNCRPHSVRPKSAVTLGKDMARLTAKMCQYSTSELYQYCNGIKKDDTCSEVKSLRSVSCISIGLGFGYSIVEVDI